MDSTNLLPFLKSLTNVEIEIVVIRILNQRDDIYSFEHVGDDAYERVQLPPSPRIHYLTIAVQDWHTGYRTVYKLVYDLKHGRFHLGSLEVLVCAELKVFQRLA